MSEMGLVRIPPLHPPEHLADDHHDLYVICPRTVDIITAKQSHCNMRQLTCVVAQTTATACVFPAAAWLEDAGLDNEKEDRFFRGCRLEGGDE